MSIYCQFYDNNQNLLSEVECSNSWVNIPQNAVCGLFYDNTYKITELELQFDTVNLTFNAQSVDHFLVVFPASQTSLLASDVRSNQYMSDVPSLSQSEKDYLKNLASGSIDFSTIVTALNSIATALSALTNLSNLSQLANIITAISNKDNQSNIVNVLEEVFIDKISSTNRQSTLKRNTGSNNSNYLTIYSVLLRIFQALSTSNFLPHESYQPQNRLLANLACLSTASNSDYDSYRDNSNLKNIDKRLQNIETKLEQNLPFTTIVDNEILETNVSQNCNYSSKIEQIPFSE